MKSLDKEINNSFVEVFMENTHDGIMVLDERFHIKQINSVVGNLLDTDKEEFIGKSILDYLSIHYQNKFAQIKNELINGNKVSNHKILLKKDNRQFFGALNASKIVNDLDVHYLFCIRDVSESQSIKRELNYKSKELETFIYRSSHDLKGPLASIMGITDIAEKDIDDQLGRKYFKMIRSSAERLNHILVSLSDLVRLRNSKITFELIDINELIEDLIIKFKLPSSKNRVDIEASIEPIEGFYSNRTLLTSVLTNVIDNSIQFRKRNERIQSFVKINVRNMESGLSITVEDNGLGIPKNLINKIFDMFEKASVHSTGAGLGLYITKTSIDHLKGAVAVESTEGEGTRMKLYFPNQSTNC